MQGIKMGLKEKRAAREFEQNRLDSLKKKIFEAAKFEFEIEINWETISVENYAHTYDQSWSLVYFQPTINAFKDMCSDEFSKEAIEGDLKKIVIQNYGDSSNANNFAEYNKGVLILNHSPLYNAETEVDRRANSIKKSVESAL